MTQKEFIEKLAPKLQWDESKTSEALEVISNILAGQLSENNEVSIENFGVFNTHKNQEYILVDSETKERFLMPPEIVVSFEPVVNESSSSELISRISFEIDDSLKSTINSAFHNFEPTLINEGVEFSGVEIFSTEDPGDEVEDLSTEGFTEIEETDVKEEFLIDDTEPHPIPDMQPERSTRPKPRSRKSSRVLVPVLGGVVIIMATLFFFNGVASRKSGNCRKSIKS